MLKNNIISSWLQNSSGVPFVWLRGNPGTGKSVIAGQLIKFLQSSPKSLVITHFCSYLYSSSTQYDNIFCSLLWQALRRDDDMIAYVYWEFVVNKKTTSGTILEGLLKTVIESLLGNPGNERPIHIILDGLDEMDNENQLPLLTMLKKVATRLRAQENYCKVLVSSRSSTTLKNSLRKQVIVSLSDERKNMEDAICIYAEQRLAINHHRLAQHGLCGEDLRRMSSRIAQKADGMYCRVMLEWKLSAA